MRRQCTASVLTTKGEKLGIGRQSSIPSLLIIPIYMPIVHALGFDQIWFVILLLFNMDMGLTTSPFGPILFVMKGVAPSDTKIGDIYKAALPFIACDAIAIALIMTFPQIALWLSSMMITP